MNSSTLRYENDPFTWIKAISVFFVINSFYHLHMYLAITESGEFQNYFRKVAETDPAYKFVSHLFRFSTNSFTLIAGILAYNSFEKLDGHTLQQKFWKFFLPRFLRIYPCYLIFNILFNQFLASRSCGAIDYIELLLLVSLGSTPDT